MRKCKSHINVNKIIMLIYVKVTQVSIFVSFILILTKNHVKLPKNTLKGFLIKQQFLITFFKWKPVSPKEYSKIIFLG